MAIKIRINDKEISAEPGTSILLAASQAGVSIPYLCYHESLSVRGSCRICLVEVEGNPKLQPACSTAVCEKMVVRTESAAVVEARKAVLELLLINHPLDCPVCDKGGECKLQEYAFRYAKGKGRFSFDKRTFPREDIGPFVVRDMNRCVHCTRCVRFTIETSLTREFAAFNRSDSTSIGTYLGSEVHSPFSGNVTELCPVGALTDRVFRFKARIWELQDVPSSCPLCPVGCLVYLQLDKGRIARVRAREGGVNRWICDLGRFGLAAVSNKRKHPVVREEAVLNQNGQETCVPWEAALEAVSGKLKTLLREKGPGSIGAFCSTSLTNEEMFSIQHVFRNVIGSTNMDFRARAATPVGLGEAEVLSCALRSQGRIEQLSDCESMLLFCSDPCEETPIAGLEILRAAASGSKVAAIGPRRPTPETFSLDWIPATPQDSALVLASIAQDIAEQAGQLSPHHFNAGADAQEGGTLSLQRTSELTRISIDWLRSMSAWVLSSPRLGLVVGRDVFSSPLLHVTLSSMLRIGAARTELGKGKTVLLSLFGDANARGALELGMFPGGEETHKASTQHPATGKSFSQMIEGVRNGELKALFVFSGDPLSECEDRRTVREALAKLDLLVVLAESFNETAKAAHIYLPLQHVSERDGSFITLDGDLHAVHPQASPTGSRSLVLDLLDSLCKAAGARLKFRDADSALRELKKVRGWSFEEDLKGLAKGHGVRLGDYPKAAEPRWAVLLDLEKKSLALLEAQARLAHAKDPDPSVRDYPFVLITGIAGFSRWVWARGISGHPSIPNSVFGEISEIDANELGVENGGMIEIESPAGSIKVRALPTKHLMKGVVFVPFGYGEAGANAIAAGEACTRVRLRKTSA